MANPWNDLPNAKHIDRMLELITRGAAWDAARDAAWGAAWDAAWGAARGAARDAARGAAWGAAWDAAWGAARGAARDAAWGAAWGAVTALVAWDDCAYLIDLPPDAVRLIAASGNHAAILLFPAVIALNKEPK